MELSRDGHTVSVSIRMGPRQSATNLKDHGIIFERAATVFLDPEALSEFDEEHNHDSDGKFSDGLSHVPRRDSGKRPNTIDLGAQSNQE